MAKQFPDWVNPWKAAEGNRVFSGSVPFSVMTRLTPLLGGDNGDVNFSTRFGQDGRGRAMVDIEVEAVLPLQCQVSLEVFRYEFSRSSRLVVVADEAGQMELPDGYEATVAEHGRLSLARLVEDECLLALPQVPRKPGLEFETYRTGAEAPGEQETRRPFAALGDLLRAGKTGQDSGNQ